MNPLSSASFFWHDEEVRHDARSEGCAPTNPNEHAFTSVAPHHARHHMKSYVLLCVRQRRRKQFVFHQAGDTSQKDACSANATPLTWRTTCDSWLTLANVVQRLRLFLYNSHMILQMRHAFCIRLPYGLSKKYFLRQHNFQLVFNHF